MSEPIPVVIAPQEGGRLFKLFLFLRLLMVD
jgi:hypothetical protein